VETSGFTFGSVAFGVKFMRYFHRGETRAGSIAFALPPYAHDWRANVAEFVDQGS